MYLKQIGIGKESKTNIAFEKVVDDLLMISIINDFQNDEILSYWRLTKVTGIPPLEIGINCKSNYLASITFYIDATYKVEHDSANVVVERGNVLVDTSIFTHTNEYFDVCQSYSVQLKNDALHCFFERGTCFKNSYKTDKLEIFVDSENQIVGFAICDLPSEQIDMIKSL
ncbi:hypothetical protein AALA13_11555 [Lachnospiraceae bacterium 50-23]|jgi:hypothetical protein